MLNKKNLKPADILIFRATHRSGFLERFIIWAQKTFYHVPEQAKYYHVALVDKDINLMLEARWPKTTISPIDFSTYKQRERIEIYRIRGITDEQREKILAWAHDHIGEWYDILLFLTGWADIKHSEICSTFVSKACRAADLDIPYGSWNKKLILPDDFYGDTIQLDRIG